MDAATKRTVMGGELQASKPKPQSSQGVALRPRVLLIEDNASRIDLFREWLAASPFAADFVLLVATTGGQAMGVVQRGPSGVAGICLDHDLNSQPKTPSDERTSGSDVVNAILNKVPRWVPVLVHSMNTVMGENMHRRLRGAGFDATRIRMSALNAQLFEKWLGEVHENWDWGD